MANSLRLPAFAKINLCLQIMGRRPDGYHELRTIFQTISLHDTLKLSLTRSRGTTLETDDATLPSGPENLVFRAIESIRREIKFTGGIHARLEANTGGARAGRRIKRRCGRAHRCAAVNKKTVTARKIAGDRCRIGRGRTVFSFRRTRTGCEPRRRDISAGRRETADGRGGLATRNRREHQGCLPVDIRGIDKSTQTP